MTIDERYDAFMASAVRTGVVWSLARATGWALVELGGKDVTPVWPDDESARAAAFGTLETYAPKPISLADWIESWLPGLERDERWVAVWPTATDAGKVVRPAELAAAMAAR